MHFLGFFFTNSTGNFDLSLLTRLSQCVLSFFITIIDDIIKILYYLEAIKPRFPCTCSWVKFTPSKILRETSRVDWPVWDFVSKMTTDVLQSRHLSLECDLPNKTYQWVYTQMSNTTGVTKIVVSAFPFGAPEEKNSLWWGLCCLDIIFLCCVLWTVIYRFVVFQLSLSWHFQFIIALWVWMFLMVCLPLFIKANVDGSATFRFFFN